MYININNIYIYKYINEITRLVPFMKLFINLLVTGIEHRENKLKLWAVYEAIVCSLMQYEISTKQELIKNKVQ